MTAGPDISRAGWIKVVKALAGLAAVVCVLGEPAQAQLIMPGELSAAHADSKGITNCNSCHALGRRGILPDRCMTCHEPIKERLAAGKGLHASFSDQNCSECHKEHQGSKHSLIALDESAFDHDETQYALTGAHEEVSCRSCHQSGNIIDPLVRSTKMEAGAIESTFLGLTTSCRTCHRSDEPHAGQFSDRECTACHTTDSWKEAPLFEHNATGFSLTGKHAGVECSSCHSAVRSSSGIEHTQYAGLTFGLCSDCHSDPHPGSFSSNCSTCHNTGGWRQVDLPDENSFDHSGTGFELLGSHSSLACANCHGKPERMDKEIQISFASETRANTYPQPQVDNCQSCHVDYHNSAFVEKPGGTDCEGCHSQSEWLPAAFGIERHNVQARFELTGAHLATPCSSCHRSEEEILTFHFSEVTCRSCHKTDDPHGDQFADESGSTTCISCHSTDAWSAVSLDHDTFGFALTGSHRSAMCAACHSRPEGSSENLTFDIYRGLGSNCEDCHGGESPHLNQFEGRGCASCHGTTSFGELAAEFSHDNTRFPLRGAHARQTCDRCHLEEVADDGAFFVRYSPMGITCVDCHSGR